MARTVSTPALIAVATGVTGAAWASGMIASLSLIGIPTALGLSGNSSAMAWAGLYNHGVALMPKVAVAVAASQLYAAYDSRGRGTKWTGYVTASVLVLSIVPYTLITMRPTNDILLAAAAGTSTYQNQEISRLIKRWGALNLARSLLPLAGALISLVTFYQNMSP